MTGLLLLTVIGLWIVACFFISKLAVRPLKDGILRILAAIAIFICLLPLPVADELLSKPAFEKLCEEHAKLKFDPEKIRGRTIVFSAVSPNPVFTAGLLNGYYLHWLYLDKETRQVLISGKSFQIQGGVLSQFISITQSRPLTMSGHCGPKEQPNQKSFLSRFDLKFVEEKENK